MSDGSHFESFLGGADERPARRWIDPVALFGKPIPPRLWIVQDWLPVGHVTLNYGDGGTGKTLLAQQLQTSTAIGQPWCGLDVMPCRSLGFYAEDDPDELHRRQAAICDAYGVPLSALGNMRWHSGVGLDNLLVTFDDCNVAIPSPLFEHIKAEAKAFGAQLVVIDTAADTFGGNENDRSQVRQFIGRVLNDLAQHIGGAVLLNAHPSRSGMSATGDMDGGSTGWSNSARSRWSLARPPGEDGEAADPDARILTRRKANYSSIGDTINLRWERGVLRRPSAGPGLGHSDEIGRRRACQEVFLDLLAKCDASNKPVSDSPNAGNHAPKVFAKRPDREGFTRKDFEVAMAALMADGKIRLETYGRKGDERRRVVVSHPAKLDEFPL
jgi:RecA-family ATPase